MVTVPAGSTLTLRCPDERPIVLITTAEARAGFVADLPPIPVFDLDGGRRFGILELVSSAGVTWTEAELRDGLITLVGDPPTDVVQRRGAPRRPGTYGASGTVQLDDAPGHCLVAVAGHVEDVSTSGLLLRASPDDSPHLPPRIIRVLLEVAMPWGPMTTAVTVVDQRSDTLRGTYEWIGEKDAAALRDFTAGTSSAS
jgi:hypothetical protein